MISMSMRKGRSSKRRGSQRPARVPKLLTYCVTCGSHRMEHRRVSVRMRSSQIVPEVEADVCSACGERYYDLAAMRKLESARHSAR